jgi:hypothetical protein
MAEVWDVPAFVNQTTGHLTTAAELNQFGNSLRFLKRVAYVEFTSNVSITATTEATANQVVSAGAITYENVPHRITFGCLRSTAPASQSMNIGLFDGTTGLGIIAFLGSTSPAQQSPIEQSRLFTPSAASHTYNIRAWVSGGTGTVEANAGGAGTNMPGFILVERIPT